jgi:hypothetical protein
MQDDVSAADEGGGAQARDELGTAGRARLLVRRGDVDAVGKGGMEGEGVQAQPAHHSPARRTASSWW